jgi:succinate dehydrogenase / fumarate reductase, cytochrome b subunit
VAHAFRAHSRKPGERTLVRCLLAAPIGRGDMASTSQRSTDPPLDAAPPASAPLRRKSYFTSTVGVKMLMAITGILFFLFLVFHLIGNLLLFVGPSTLNGYSHWLIVNPFIIPAEIGLLAIFVIHVFEAVANYLQNRRARPTPYYQPVRRIFGRGWAGRPSRKSFSSTSMIVTGLITLIFVIVHIVQFKYGPDYPVTSPSDGTPGVRDIYRLVLHQFSNGAIVIFYVFCLVVIGIHLWHGLTSALNSLGLDSPRYTPALLKIGRVVAVVMAGAFLSMPLWVFFVRG